jgi:hypothetical protein
MNKPAAEVEPTVEEGVWDRRRRLVAAEIEQVALRLFAEQGDDNVTTDDKKFVRTARRYRTVHIPAGNANQLRPLLREYFPAAFEAFQGTKSEVCCGGSTYSPGSRTDAGACRETDESPAAPTTHHRRDSATSMPGPVPPSFSAWRRAATR